MNQVAHQAGCYSVKQTQITLYQVKHTKHGLLASTQLSGTASLEYKVDSDLHRQLATFEHPELRTCSALQPDCFTQSSIVAIRSFSRC